MECSIRDLVKYPISQLEGLLYEEIKNVEEKVTNTKKLWELLNLDIKNKYYIIFAKSFKERIKDDKTYLFDLKDLENIMY